MINGNSVDCSASQKGTGLVECIQELGKPNGFIDISSSWTADRITDTIDLAYINNQVLLGNYTPFPDSVDFVDNTEDDVFQTFTSGQKRIVRDGLPEFDFVYTNGYQWHAAAYSHNTNQNGAIALIWENGVIGFAMRSGNTIGGLKRGYMKTKPFQNNDGSNVSQTMVSFQLLSALEYNTKMYLLNEDTLGFSLGEIKGAVDVTFEINTPIAVGATAFSAKVHATANRNIAVLGLLPANVQLTGQTIGGAVYNAATQEYDFTIDAATAGTKTLSLGNGTTENGVDLSGTIYSGVRSLEVA